MQPHWTAKPRRSTRRGTSRESLDAARWEEVYRCPATGRRFLLDYPHGEPHGGGPPRLRAIADGART